MAGARRSVRPLAARSSSCRFHRPPALGSEHDTEPLPARTCSILSSARTMLREPSPIPKASTRSAPRSSTGNAGTSATRSTTPAHPARRDVPFIGIAAKANPRYDELVRLLRAEGAVAVLDDINSLEAAIAHEPLNCSATRKKRKSAANCASKAAAATRSQPAFASSITCWSCSRNTAASI